MLLSHVNKTKNPLKQLFRMRVPFSYYGTGTEDIPWDIKTDHLTGIKKGFTSLQALKYPLRANREVFPKNLFGKIKVKKQG